MPQPTATLTPAQRAAAELAAKQQKQKPAMPNADKVYEKRRQQTKAEREHGRDDR